MDDNQLLDVELKIEDQNEYSYASFGDRLVAAILDGLILAIPNVIFKFVLPEGVADLATILLGWLYGALLESGDNQATLGKKAMNIRVTDLDGERISFGKASIRHFSKIISALLILIGYLMQPFTEKRQALHDMIAGTLVYKT
jgi:uncharacterized RDD family membrane protein YckC